MAKQITIEDIAKLSGVSVGTVDRILHNRGRVAPGTRAVVEKVLAETGYRYNIHTSAVALRKGYRIAVAMPAASKGEYWGSIHDGISHALDEFSDISIDCSFSFYDQSDGYSCRTAFENVAEHSPDGVLIGGTFRNEILKLCSSLDMKKIPYIFMDDAAEGCRPVAAFSADRNTCGRLIGRMLDIMSPPPHKQNNKLKQKELAVFHSLSENCQEKHPDSEIRAGLLEYFTSAGQPAAIHEIVMPLLSPEECRLTVEKFMDRYPQTSGMAVINSRGSVIAGILGSIGIRNMPLVALDLTAGNRKCLAEGSISAVISRHPELQGFNAVKAVIRYLLYGQRDKEISHLMPIDIVVAENLPYYRNILSD